MIKFLRLVTILLLASVITAATAQESEAQLLDGMELEYTYADGGSVVLNFYDGKLKYRWIAGPFAGTEAFDRDYRAKEIGGELYLLNWHDIENSNFVTLVINLQRNVLHSSAIIGYGTEQENTLFDVATIDRVTD